MKEKFKWFICVIAVITISMFILLDSTTYKIGGAGAEDGKIEIELPNEEELPPVETPGDTETPKEPSEEEEVVVIPTYSNGYKCLTDAYARFYEAENYVVQDSSTGGGDILGIGAIQNIVGTTIKSGDSYSVETIAYSDSSFGECFYRKTSTTDGQTYDYIKSNITYADMTYSLEGAINEQVDFEGAKERIGENGFDLFYIKCVQGRDKVIGFKRDHAKYYIIDVAFNVDKLPASKVDAVIRESGASACRYNFCNFQYYVNKKTGRIDKFIQKESYEVDKVVTVTIAFSSTTIIKYN